MTRIVSGSVGGRRIRVPPRGTRPTADRVREAVFARLDSRGAISGSRVLDAFAGSGALGLEALSRGAARATFVESNRAAARVVEANLVSLGLDGLGHVVQASVEAFLGSGEEAFDLALLDPPYDLHRERISAVLEALVGRLAPGALVVLERPSRGEPVPWPPGIAPEEVRVYGDTSIHFGRVEAPAGGGTLEA
jgi:16S rRNA (guanine966-N2)-methyltransferase